VRLFRDYVFLYLKAVAMGVADVIPGVSGGTIAFVTGIYEELLKSIKSVSLEALRLLARFRMADFWRFINGNFLIVLLAGLATSWLSLARLMTYLLAHHPVPVWSFFFGLILASTFLVYREVTSRKPGVVVAALAGASIAYWITELTPTETPETLWFVFLSGALAICAMILPGISGAFILLLLGKYQFIITEVLIRFNIPVATSFAAGCILGIMAFSRVLTWILANYHNLTVSLLAGFMVGSLNKVWPWKVSVLAETIAGGESVPVLEDNLLPWAYSARTGSDAHEVAAIVFLCLGVALVAGLDRLSRRLRSKS
jgi:putative membrane protein